MHSYCLKYSSCSETLQIRIKHCNVHSYCLIYSSCSETLQIRIEHCNVHSYCLIYSSCSFGLCWVDDVIRHLIYRVTKTWISLEHDENIDLVKTPFFLIWKVLPNKTKIKLKIFRSTAPLSIEIKIEATFHHACSRYIFHVKCNIIFLI